jgi:hypothetical protein
MKIFYLNRTEDESGISGTGRVAQGFIFDNEVSFLIMERFALHGFQSIQVLQFMITLEKLEQYTVMLVRPRS